jgi:hypothetical protein
MKLMPPDRISLSEVVRTIKPLMSRSTFYGSPEDRGPRWTEVDRLEIRSGRYGVTADRKRFERWYRELQGDLATSPHATAARLGGNARRVATEETYGQQLAALCAALQKEVITQDQFERALATLPTAA